MTSERVARRLAAILAADVVGFSRLMGADEVGTLARLKAVRKDLIDPAIAARQGRIVKTTGDGLLVEFASVVDAVESAIAVQRAIAERNTRLPEDQRIVLRIGVNLGDVIVEDDDIYGDGVNVAARLEALAEPGGLLISQTVYENIAGKLDAAFADNGERAFKNIANPIRVWSWPDRLPDWTPPEVADKREGKPLVLVSAFEGRREAEKELADGIRDELIAALARLTGLELTVDDARAHYVIRGGVRQAGRRCRVSVQLIGVEGEKQLWADRYDEEFDDPFEMQDRCATRIAMSVRRRIAADDAERIAGRDPGQDLGQLSLEELLSVAGVSFFTPTKAGWRRGGAIAEQALERDPENFMALAMAAAGGGMAEIFYGYREVDDAVIDTAFRRIEAAQRLTDKSDLSAIVYSGLLLYGRARHEEARPVATMPYARSVAGVPSPVTGRDHCVFASSIVCAS